MSFLSYRVIRWYGERYFGPGISQHLHSIFWTERITWPCGFTMTSILILLRATFPTRRSAPIVKKSDSKIFRLAGSTKNFVKIAHNHEYDTFLNTRAITVLPNSRPIIIIQLSSSNHYTKPTANHTGTNSFIRIHGNNKRLKSP